MPWRRVVARGLRGLGVVLIVPAGFLLIMALLGVGGRRDFEPLVSLLSVLVWGVLSFLCFRSASGLLAGRKGASSDAVVAVVAGVLLVWLVVNTAFPPASRKCLHGAFLRPSSNGGERPRTSSR